VFEKSNTGNRRPDTQPARQHAGLHEHKYAPAMRRNLPARSAAWAGVPCTARHKRAGSLGAERKASPEGGFKRGRSEQADRGPRTS